MMKDNPERLQVEAVIRDSIGWALPKTMTYCFPSWRRMMIFSSSIPTRNPPLSGSKRPKSWANASG